jgi:beta-glucosidase/6-phospho-beta-glucosidase/beta-galactosidase
LDFLDFFVEYIYDYELFYYFGLQDYECSMDWVRIYDGIDATHPAIVWHGNNQYSVDALCGWLSWGPGQTISSGNSLFIEFISDHMEDKRGFRIDITFICK